MELNPQGKCVKCSPNYTLENDQCKAIKKIDNCVRTDDNNKCIICEDRYYTNANKTACNRVGYLCQRFNPQTGFCFTCSSNVSLVNGKCVDPNCLLSTINSCSSCKSGFLFNETAKICEKNDPFCKDKFNGKCVTCKDGFYLNAE